MNKSLNKKLGLNLLDPTNIGLFKAPYNQEQYITNVLDVRLKVLPTVEENSYHFITGMTSEFIELLSPYLQLLSLAKYGEIRVKDLSPYDDNLLWNLLEEMGDYQFFRNGLVRELNLSINKPSNIREFKYLVNEINQVITNVGYSKIPKFFTDLGDVLGMSSLIMKLIELITSLMKKNVISGKEKTFESFKRQIEAIVYCFDLCFDYILKTTNELTIRCADCLITSTEDRTLIYGEVECAENYVILIDYNTVYNLNDMKLSKRYKGALTNSESDNRDYEKEKVVK